MPVFASVAPERQPHWQHALTVYDAPRYPGDFHHFQTANPNAPKGGHVRFGIHGSFDSLNFYITKGTTPASAPNVFRYGVLELNEPLMAGMGVYAPVQEESGTLYGIIAESVYLSDDRRTLEFKLRPEARFHDQHPITSADVVYSAELLREYGAPHYQLLLEQVESVQAVSPHHVRYRLEPSGSRTLPLMIAELPVLPEHYWKTREFGKTTLEPPLLSGPYRISSVKPGSSVVFKRVPGYWGKDLPVNRGFYNFDKVTLDFYRDRRVAFEAFRSGELDAFIEAEAKNWASGYNLPAFHSGRMKKIEVPYSLPGSRRFFAFNIRKAKFADQRTRAAISMLFDWEWSNSVLFHNAYQRSTSFFPLPDFAASGEISAAERKILEPFSKDLPDGLFNKPFHLEIRSTPGDSRVQLHKALELLKAAGWHYKKGRLVNDSGQFLSIEFLHYSKTIERFILPYAHNLQSVGIQMAFKAVDMSQYQRRLKKHDFDMVQTSVPLMPFPDERLFNLFHSESANREGSRNLVGISHPVVDHLIEAAVRADSREQLAILVRALDRVLLWQHYTVPNWHSNVIRIAYWNHLRFPEKIPEYGFRLRNWWVAPELTHKQETR